MDISALTGHRKLRFHWNVVTDVLSIPTKGFLICEFRKVTKFQKCSKYCHNLPTCFIYFFRLYVMLHSPQSLFGKIIILQYNITYFILTTKKVAATSTTKL